MTSGTLVGHTRYDARMLRHAFLFSLTFVVESAYAQNGLPFAFEPEGTHANLYFPQLALGGNDQQTWESRFSFFNPNHDAAVVTLYVYDSAGQAMGNLITDVAARVPGEFAVSIPANGRRLVSLRSASATVLTGWAMALSTRPVQGSILFRTIERGRPALELAAFATLPTRAYTSLANRQLGVAIANTGGTTAPVTLEFLDANGVRRATRSLSLGARRQTAFNLGQFFSLGEESGTLLIRGPLREQIICWTLNADLQTGLLATLPPGPQKWPISHQDRIENVFYKVYTAATNLARSIAGVDLRQPVVQLDIGSEPVINAFAASGRVIQINLALSELISDSPSELAFVVGHELGHIIQQRARRTYWDLNRERDADYWGLLINLFAGFDPYGGAGALAKLSMANGQSGLVAQYLATGEHGAFSERLNRMFEILQTMCADRQWRTFCEAYRQTIHPSFPGTVPLSPGEEERSIAIRARDR